MEETRLSDEDCIKIIKNLIVMKREMDKGYFIKEDEFTKINSMIDCDMSGILNRLDGIVSKLERLSVPYH
jgi:hypothetical protein